MSAARLTPAQQRGLLLLATPDAEARTARSIFWRAEVDGAEIGRIHSETLLALREAGYVWFGRRAAGELFQRITEAGRERARALEAR